MINLLLILGIKTLKPLAPNKYIQQSRKELEKNEDIWLNFKEYSTNCNKKGITRVICSRYHGKGIHTTSFQSFQLLDPFKVRSFKKLHYSYG